MKLKTDAHTEKILKNTAMFNAEISGRLRILTVSPTRPPDSVGLNRAEKIIGRSDETNKRCDEPREKQAK
jgi:hypothetical protein